MEADSQTCPARRLEIAIQVRAFEIDLLWKRALFFWGLIASAFVGYAAVYRHSLPLAAVIACFGTVASLAWSLANRGSKYWQENWETKVNASEKAVIGAFFQIQESRQKKGWFSAQRYSVSKLVIALSDFTFVVWLGLASYPLLRLSRWEPGIRLSLPCVTISFAGFTALYILFILVKTRSTKPTPEQQPRPAVISTP